MFVGLSFVSSTCKFLKRSACEKIKVKNDRCVDKVYCTERDFAFEEEIPRRQKLLGLSFDDVSGMAEVVQNCPALMRRDLKALNLKCTYIADQCGCPLSDVHSLVKLKPCLLIKSPSRVVAHLQATARLLQVPLNVIVKQAAINPKLIEVLDDGRMAKLSSRTLKALFS
ncbi:hypothetical protein CEUSTIGMA_g8527.t1 [Chlamydomonas eustigma]|uniref:Uncharacterized protein n=1 Tax=Chlamydomonas eustigma TaxID=1157962 RepID=A0A250XDC6_9CHLO|nr:hypothetical protein CEUSTIGMA_g8527.t1 [Chlamydomonas eustigma]|eukprot:GAX81093.1 hypothetical protein CEUSTIGMA_g8527.t1 [Chlamydomonas eustigma]